MSDKIPADKLVTVVPAMFRDLPKPPVPSFIIMFDPTARQIREMLAAFPKYFIFVFCTLPVEKAPNLNSIRSDSVAMPVYIGNFRKRDQMKVVTQYIKVFEDAWNTDFRFKRYRDEPLQPSVPEEQVDQQQDQQNAADTEAALVSPLPISKPAAEDQE